METTAVWVVLPAVTRFSVSVPLIFITCLRKKIGMITTFQGLIMNLICDKYMISISVAVRRHPLLLVRRLFLAAMQEKRLFVLLGAV